MSLAKSHDTITQLTATGQSTSLDIRASYRQSLYVKHYNGSGSVSAAGTAKIQVKPNGSSTWYDLVSVAFGTTTGGTDTSVIPIPDDAGSVRLDYTAPSGASGFTLDAEVGLITAY